MKIWRFALELGTEAGPHSVTLGLFDGVHLGHRELLGAAVRGGRRRSIPSAVVTFDPHPTVVVAPERRPRLLMTLDQRVAAFEEAGLDLAWVIPFSRGLSERSPADFLDLLGRVLRPTELHVGTAFHFGRDRSGGLETLQAWGGGADCAVHGHGWRAPDGGALSSSRIRECLGAGEVEQASQLLGRPYVLTGIVEEGERRGRHLGFPTANLAFEQEQLPAKGVYITEVRSPHFPEAQLGLTNVGEKPTFHGQRLTVETFLPDFSGDLYGARLQVAFLRRLRGELSFPGPEALREQIAADVVRGVAWWKRRD